MNPSVKGRTFWQDVDQFLIMCLLVASVFFIKEHNCLSRSDLWLLGPVRAFLCMVKIITQV